MCCHHGTLDIRSTVYRTFIPSYIPLAPLPLFFSLFFFLRLSVMWKADARSFCSTVGLVPVLALLLSLLQSFTLVHTLMS